MYVQEEVEAAAGVVLDEVAIVTPEELEPVKESAETQPEQKQEQKPEDDVAGALFD